MKILRCIVIIFLSIYCYSSCLKLKNMAMPGKLIASEKHIIITDKKLHKIFILSIEGKDLFVLGKSGLGPGEISNIENIQIRTNDLFISDGVKVLRYDYHGNLLDEQKLLKSISSPYKAETGWFGSEITQNSSELFMQIRFYDNNFLVQNTMEKIEIPSPFSPKIELVENCHRLEYSNDSIVFANTALGFHFTVFSLTGNKLDDINLVHYPLVKLSKAWVEKKKAELKSIPQIELYWDQIKKNISIPEYFPAYNDFSLSNNGSILARTYLVQNENSLFLLLEKGAAKWQKIELPQNILYSDGSLNRHFCHNDNSIFYIIEDEDGDFELFIKNKKVFKKGAN